MFSYEFRLRFSTAAEALDFRDSSVPPEHARDRLTTVRITTQGRNRTEARAEARRIALANGAEVQRGYCQPVNLVGGHIARAR